MGIDRRTEQPHDRLTRMCAVMTDAFEAHPEHRENDKCIVFLDDGGWGGIQLHGYENDSDAMVDLMQHMEAIFEANGITMTFVPAEKPIGEG